MKRTKPLFPLFLAVLLLALPLFNSCGESLSNALELDLNDESLSNTLELDSETTSGNEETTTPTEPYALVFESLGNGTCSVKINVNPSWDSDISVEIPEASPEGDAVVTLSDSNFQICPNVPRIISKDAFTAILTTAEKTAEGNTHSTFLLKKLSAYYNLFDPSNTTVPLHAQEMKDTYPICEFVPIFVLDPHTTPTELPNISEILTDLAKYDLTACLNDFNALVSKASKIDADLIKDMDFGSFTDNVTEIILPSTLQSIEPYALKNCISLKELSIPKNVSSLCGSSFKDSLNLSKITIDKANDTYEIVNNCIMEKNSSSLVYAPPSVTLTEEMNVIYIKSHAFCNAYDSVIIPVSVREIESEAFNHYDKIYYLGTRADFSFVNAPSLNIGSVYLYYPDGAPDTQGRYWYYNNGVPTEW